MKQNHLCGHVSVFHADKSIGDWEASSGEKIKPVETQTMLCPVEKGRRLDSCIHADICCTEDEICSELYGVNRKHVHLWPWGFVVSQLWIWSVTAARRNQTLICTSVYECTHLKLNVVCARSTPRSFSADWNLTICCHLNEGKISFFLDYLFRLYY